MDVDFVRKNVLIEEAHFDLNGYQTPEFGIIQDKVYPSVTVWCGFWADGMIESYSFEDDAMQ